MNLEGPSNLTLMEYLSGMIEGGEGVDREVERRLKGREESVKLEWDLHFKSMNLMKRRRRSELI